MPELVELELRKPGAASSSPTPLPAVPDADHQAFGLGLLRAIADVLPRAESAEAGELRARLLEHRRILSEARHPQEVRAEAAACIRTCEQYLRQTFQDQQARENELTDLVSLLREAASRLLGDASTFNARLLSSADRFKAISALEDIRQLKRELADEVAALRRVVEEKQQRDQAAIAQLSQQVELLQSDLVRAEEAAITDPLTRVANRGAFDRLLPELVAKARAARTPLTLALLDVDHFKTINDGHGHPVGDRVLRCTAEWVRGSLRHTDLVARYGGDEFAAVVSDADLRQAVGIFTQVVQQIGERDYEYEQNGETKRVRFTLSCGLAQLTGDETEAALMHRADEALYEAKSKGRNRVAARKASRLGRLWSR